MKKFIIILFFFGVLIAQEEKTIGLGFVPNFIEGKKVISVEKIISDYSNSALVQRRVTSTAISQESLNVENEIVGKLNFYSIKASYDDSFIRFNMTKDEVFELKEGLEILLKKEKESIMNRKEVFVDYTIYRNSSNSNLISFSSEKKFDSDELEFTNEVIFYKYDEVVARIGYSFRKTSYKSSIWWFDDIPVDKRGLVRSIDKLYQYIIERDEQLQEKDWITIWIFQLKKF